MIKGLGASFGYALGKVFVLEEENIIEKITIKNVKKEIEKFEKAIDSCKLDLKDLIDTTKLTIGLEESKIFEAHLMMLEDPEFIDKSKELISSKKVNSAWAVSSVSKSFIEIFESIDDSYLKERAIDIKDVTKRLVDKLLDRNNEIYNRLGVIIVANDLAPSDTAKMDINKILGFITRNGGVTSHSAIVARTKGIPAIVGLGDDIENIKNGDIIAFDGNSGQIFINPSEEIKNKFIRLNDEYLEKKEELKTFIGKKTISKDGKVVEIGCNIGSPKDLEYVLDNDGEGIGLYRSEFLFMDRKKFPNEEEQFLSYKTVLEKMNGKPVVIRTLDVGGDKNISYIKIPKEDNPFLGYRAIRYCLKNPDIFKVQIRALLRASNYGNLKIMFPMISSIGEIRQAKTIIEECKKELENEGIILKNKYEVGIMIEIPSAAIISDLLAKEVDFFSIGTNDLIQYTSAVDRMNQTISELYTPFHPAVLRLIKLIIENGHKNNIWVGMCGSVSGNPELIPLLLGMGLDEFSMNPSKVLNSRKIISKTDAGFINEKIDEILNISDAFELRNTLKNIL